MSLIKAADVPKHLADRLRSRRLATRLSSGAAKKSDSGRPLVVPVVPVETPES